MVHDENKKTRSHHQTKAFPNSLVQYSSPLYFIILSFANSHPFLKTQFACEKNLCVPITIQFFFSKMDLESMMTCDMRHFISVQYIP